MRMRLILLQKSLITKFITLKVCKSDDFLDTWWDYIFKSDSYPFLRLLKQCCIVLLACRSEYLPAAWTLVLL